MSRQLKKVEELKAEGYTQVKTDYIKINRRHFKVILMKGAAGDVIAVNHRGGSGGWSGALATLK